MVSPAFGELGEISGGLQEGYEVLQAGVHASGAGVGCDVGLAIGFRKRPL